MEFVRLLHSGGRWLVLAVLVVALLRFLLGLMQKQPFDALSQTLMKVFNAVLGIQFLLGVGMLTMKVQEGLTRQNYEHAFTMLVAVMLTGMMPRRWRSLPDPARYRNHFVLLLVVVAIIVFGILRLPDGIQWRFLT